MPQYNIKQVKGASQGSVLFLGSNGKVVENNTKLFWENTSGALLIGTNSLFGSEKFRVFGSQRIDGDLVITGSFSVLGSASFINTQNLLVQDPIILLAATQSGAPVLDSGFFINRGTGATQGVIWDESASEFSFIQTDDGASVMGNVNITSYAKVRAGGLTVSQLKISSGASPGYVLMSTDVNGLGAWVTSSSFIGPSINTVIAGTGMSVVSGLTVATVSINNTGVVAAQYGSTNSVSQVTFNLQGQATSATSVSIVLNALSNINNFTASAITSVLASANFTDTATIDLTANSSTVNANIIFGSITASLLNSNGGVGGATAGYMLTVGSTGSFYWKSPLAVVLAAANFTDTSTIDLTANGSTVNAAIIVASITSSLLMSNGGATAGYVLSVGSTGSFYWIPSGGGSITSIVAGTGLTGGGSSGVVTIGASATNGLNVDVVSDSVELGGPLTKNTLISAGLSNAFTMSSNGATLNIELVTQGSFHTFSHQVAAGGSPGAFTRAITGGGPGHVQQFLVDNAKASFQVTIGTQSGLASGSVSNIIIYNTDNAVSGSDASINNRMLVTDDVYKKGLVYSNDYTANFTNNSLITKGWVISNTVASVISGTGIAILNGATVSINNTGVVAAQYGSTNSVSQVTFNLQGQATSATSVSIVLNALSNINNFTASAITSVLAAANFTDTATIDLTANSSTVTAAIIVGSITASLLNSAGGIAGATAGYILSVGATGSFYWVPRGAGSIVSVNGGTGISVITTAGSGNATVSIANSGVVASTYGSTNSVPSVTFNLGGQAIAATAVSIVLNALSNINNFTASAITSVLSAANFTDTSTIDLTANGSTVTAAIIVASITSSLLMSNGGATSGYVLSVGPTGSFNWVSNAAGSITSVNGGTGISVITSSDTGSATVSINNTGVVAAQYGSTNSVSQVTFNLQGQATSATSVSIVLNALANINNFTASAITSVLASANFTDTATIDLTANSSTVNANIIFGSITASLLNSNGGVGGATAGYMLTVGSTGSFYWKSPLAVVLAAANFTDTATVDLTANGSTVNAAIIVGSITASLLNSAGGIAGATAGYVLSVGSTGSFYWIPSGGGSITSIVAGTGLTGGGSSGVVTIGASATNGLNVDVVSDSVELGGPLTKNTLISAGLSNAFTMSSNGATLNIEVVTQGSFHTFSHQSTSTGAFTRAITGGGPGHVQQFLVDNAKASFQVTIGTQSGLASGSVSNIIIYNTDNAVSGSDASINNRMLVTDDVYKKGLVYSNDYTANFTNNSLITKGWVISNAITSIIAGTGIAVSGATVSINNTGVVASTYGSTNSVPSVTFNLRGQAIAATAVSIVLNALSNINNFTASALTSIFQSTNFIDSSTVDFSLFGATAVTAFIAPSSITASLLNSAGGIGGATAGYVLSVGSTGSFYWIPSGGGSITGTGTASYLTRWITSTQIGSSNITHGGTGPVGFGTASPTHMLSIDFDSNFQDGIEVRNNSNGAGAITNGVFKNNTPASAGVSGTFIDIGILGGGNTVNSTTGGPNDVFLRTHNINNFNIINFKPTAAEAATASYIFKVATGASIAAPTSSSMMMLHKGTQSATQFSFAFGIGAANFGQTGYIANGTASGAARFRYGEFSVSSAKVNQSAINSYGSAISSILTAAAETSGAATSTMYLDSIGTTGSQVVYVPLGSGVGYRVSVVAVDGTASRSSFHILQGVVRRPANGVIALDGSTNTAVYNGFTNSSVAITADSTDNSMKIAVTGIAGYNIRWVARIDLVQVIAI